jgi:Flp pilus assembly protein TadD
VAYERTGQRALAEKEYRHSLHLRPHQSRTRVNLGNIQASQERWPAAERAYRRALRDSASDTDAMNNLAIAILRQGRRHDEARLWAERAVAAGGANDSLYRSTLTEIERAER